ncbi:MAG: hypothetical protein WC878_03495 [Candidatus Paceibacterota bacterium]
MSQKFKIVEVENVFDDHLLDIIGNEFKFDHPKGMAEWLKNAVDAYRRNNVRQDDQYVVLRFTDQGVASPTVECVDFVGMSKVDIDKAFKRWGDPTAAKRGTKIKVYGGHGNGGKFYMRQMFERSHFITYKDGLINVFGFSENKKYGYDQGYQDKKMSPKEALDFAEISSTPVPDEIKRKIFDGKTGFTVVQGIGPEGLRGKFNVGKDVNRFKQHPQSRRILERSSVIVIHNNDIYSELLKPDELEPLPGFVQPRIITVPETLIARVGTEKITVKMADSKYPQGKLVLKTSIEAMARGSKLGELNRIDILGELGVLGSYQLTEMGVTKFPYAAFVYGEFGPASEGESSILEDAHNDCVSNDRSKLVGNTTTKALLDWIAGEIDKLANEIGAAEREKQKANQRDITSKFNDILNEWKNKHMSKIMSDIFGAKGTGGGGGGGGVRPPYPGTEVTVPMNGFDFKYPQAEIEINTPSNITLKVSVPQGLPLGATVFFSSDSNKILPDESKMVIRSEYLKTTSSGQEVAFLNISVLGTEIGAEGSLTASAGNLSSIIKLKVVGDKSEKSDKKAFPQVLLSGHSSDPLNLEIDGSLILGERHPVVYQRPQDVEANIYWINTASPMASKIYDKFKFDSIQWRNFLFERYVDIFIKEAIRELEKKQIENFNADTVENKVSDVIMRVHQSASEDLDQFLFDQDYGTGS